jgi:hypothetical protein
MWCKGNDLVYARKVDHGLDKKSAAYLRERLTPLIRKTQPYNVRFTRESDRLGLSQKCRQETFAK